MNNELNIKEKTINLLNEAEQQVQEQFKNQEEICLYNSIKVLNAFKKHNISEIHFNQTTGYGYNDLVKGYFCNAEEQSKCRVFSDIKWIWLQ